jgi:hypothetical protein
VYIAVRQDDAQGLGPFNNPSSIIMAYQSQLGAIKLMLQHLPSTN